MAHKRNIGSPAFFILLLLLVGTVVPLRRPGLVAAMAADTPRADRQALADDEVKQLLLLMDADKNGKISKEEFMKFMEAEFDRLDKDHSGELDTRELTQSRIRSSRHGGAIGR